MASARSVQPRRGRPGLQRRQPSFDRAYEAVEIFRSQLIGIDFGDPANVECQPYCQPRGTAAELIVQQVFRLLVVAALALVATEAFAHDLPCDAFRRNLFGSWSARRLATIQGPQGPIALRRGRTFRPGEYYKGLDFAALLERRCRGGPSTIVRSRKCFHRTFLAVLFAETLLDHGPLGGQSPFMARLDRFP